MYFNHQLHFILVSSTASSMREISSVFYRRDFLISPLFLKTERLSQWWQFDNPFHYIASHGGRLKKGWSEIAEKTLRIELHPSSQSFHISFLLLFFRLFFSSRSTLKPTWSSNYTKLFIIRARYDYKFKNGIVMKLRVERKEKYFLSYRTPRRKDASAFFFSLRTHASFLGRYTQVSKKERDGASFYFLSFATYLNCFLMGLPSMSTKRKVLVAEVASPRHLVGFQRPGALHTLFRLGALILSTDFFTASKRSKRAQ